jgi:hypothetical protein
METKKKTALQDAISYYEDQISSYDDIEYPRMEQVKSIRFIQSIIKHLKSLLQKEKEDLIEAFEVGYGSGISELGTNYFTETFE